MLALASAAHAAEDVRLDSAEIRAVRPGYELNAQFVLKPNPTLADALEKGVALHFVVTLEITRPRNWWFDQTVGEATRRMRIYYNLLLRRYVVDAGYVTRTVPTLAEALAVLGRIEHWQVLERGALVAGRPYLARIRLRMDSSQLAKPLRLSAMASDTWELESNWIEWQFDAPPAPKPAPLLP